MHITSTAHVATTRPGNSGQSVGHLAKAAVAEAQTSGVSLPKNAQGIAASQIAKGADPASVFAAQVDPGTEEAIVTTLPPVEGQPASEAETGYTVASGIVGDAVFTEAETALQLLQQA